jgi:hypothetical protein
LPNANRRICKVATTTDFDRLSRLTRRLTDRPFTPLRLLHSFS